MFELGVEILPWHEFPLEVALRDVAKLGFRAVNLWSSKPPLADHINPGDDAGKIRTLLREAGLTVSALTAYGMNQAEMQARMELAAEIGAPIIIFDCEAAFGDLVGKFLPPLLKRSEELGVKIAVENHITVPFTADFEAGGHEEERWEEGVDSLAQIKRLVAEVAHPSLGVCLAPPHLWVMKESVSEAITYLAEVKKLFFYYVWDIDSAYVRGKDGLNFGTGDVQLPRPDGTLDHSVLLKRLYDVNYSGIVSLKCHGIAGWGISKVRAQVEASAQYVRSCMPREV